MCDVRYVQKEFVFVKVQAMSHAFRDGSVKIFGGNLKKNFIFL